MRAETGAFSRNRRFSQAFPTSCKKKPPPRLRVAVVFGECSGSLSATQCASTKR